MEGLEGASKNRILRDGITGAKDVKYVRSLRMDLPLWELLAIVSRYSSEPSSERFMGFSGRGGLISLKLVTNYYKGIN